LILQPNTSLSPKRQSVERKLLILVTQERKNKSTEKVCDEKTSTNSGKAPFEVEQGEAVNSKSNSSQGMQANEEIKK
jgi:hypothetical protein